MPSLLDSTNFRVPVYVAHRARPRGGMRATTLTERRVVLGSQCTLVSLGCGLSLQSDWEYGLLGPIPQIPI